MTDRTVAQHLASKQNLRQRHYTRLSDAAAAKREAWRVRRVELTPTYNTDKPAERETAERAGE